MNTRTDLLESTKVEYKQNSPIEGELAIQIAGPYIEKRMEGTFAGLQGKAEVKGFRKGKVPATILRQKFRHQVIRDTFESLVTEACRAAAGKEKLPVVGEPRVLRTNWLTWKEGDSMEFTARVELVPKPELKNYKGLSFSVDDFSVDDERVEFTIKQILEPRSELRAIDSERGIRIGDFVMIDFQGSADGVPVKDASAENFLLEVGGPNTMRDFQDGILGMKAGETREVNVQYPADYNNAEIAGKAMVYSVKLHEIKTKIYPELNDELAKEFKAESVADLKEKIRENISAQARQEEKTQKEERLLRALLEANPFQVPVTLIQFQLNQIVREISQVLEKQKFSGKLIEEYLMRHISELQSRAEREVKLALLLPKVVEQEKIVPSDAELEERLEFMAKASGRDLAELKKTFASGEPRENLRSQIARDQAIDRLLSLAKITTEKRK